MNNTTHGDSPEAITVVCTVLTALCAVFVVVVNAVTLSVVCGVTMERQKKQLVSLLLADIYNGLIGLPISVMQFNHLDVFQCRLVCLLSFGIADLGALLIITFCAVFCLTSFLTLRFPFRSLTFSNWDTRFCVTQWAFPVFYMAGLCFLLSREAEGSNDTCDWSRLPKWYFYTFGATLFPIMTLAFVSACGILCIARQQGITIAQMSANCASSIHSQNRYAKQRRLAKLILFAFFVTWIPFTVIMFLIFFSSEIPLDDELFYLLYISVLSVTASVPVLFCYTVKGVKPRLNTLVKRLNLCHCMAQKYINP